MPTVKFKDISRFVGVEDFLFGGSVQGNDIYGHYFREEWEGFHCVHEEGQKGFEDFKDCIKNLLEDYGVDTELQCVERGKDTFNFKMPPEEHLKGYYKEYIISPIEEFNSKEEAEKWILNWLGKACEGTVRRLLTLDYLWEEGYLVEWEGNFLVTMKNALTVYSIIEGFEEEEEEEEEEVN